MNKILINGVGTEFISVMDRGIHYGDGLFETLLYKDGKLQFWDQHISRMKFGAKVLKIDFPDEQIFFDDTCDLIKQNSYDSAVIKLILTRGSSERGYVITGKQYPMRIAIISEHKQPSITGGINATICQQSVSINKNLAGIKHLNRLENVIARNEWNDEYHEGIMLDANNYVIEGTMSNLFIVKNKEVFTPNLSGSGIKGIIRENIIEISKNEGIKLVEKQITLEDLLDSDEVFITNSLIGIQAVQRINDSEFKQNEISQFFKNKLDPMFLSHAKAIH